MRKIWARVWQDKEENQIEVAIEYYKEGNYYLVVLEYTARDTRDKERIWRARISREAPLRGRRVKDYLVWMLLSSYCPLVISKSGKEYREQEAEVMVTNKINSLENASFVTLVHGMGGETEKISTEVLIETINGKGKEKILSGLCSYGLYFIKRFAGFSYERELVEDRKEWPFIKTYKNTLKSSDFEIIVLEHWYKYKAFGDQYKLFFGEVNLANQKVFYLDAEDLYFFHFLTSAKNNACSASVSERRLFNLFYYNKHLISVNYYVWFNLFLLEFFSSNVCSPQFYSFYNLILELVSGEKNRQIEILENFFLDSECILDKLSFIELLKFVKAYLRAQNILSFPEYLRNDVFLSYLKKQLKRKIELVILDNEQESITFEVKFSPKLYFRGEIYSKMLLSLSKKTGEFFVLKPRYFPSESFNFLTILDIPVNSVV